MEIGDPRQLAFPPIGLEHGLNSWVVIPSHSAGRAWLRFAYNGVQLLYCEAGLQKEHTQHCSAIGVLELQVAPQAEDVFTAVFLCRQNSQPRQANFGNIVKVLLRPGCQKDLRLHLVAGPACRNASQVNRLRFTCHVGGSEYCDNT